MIDSPESNPVKNISCYLLNRLYSTRSKNWFCSLYIKLLLCLWCWERTIGEINTSFISACPLFTKDQINTINMLLTSLVKNRNNTYIIESWKHTVIYFSKRNIASLIFLINFISKCDFSYTQFPFLLAYF